MKKRLIKKVTIWVASKPGARTGYGKTAKAAFDDAVNKDAVATLHVKTRANLEARIKEEIRKTEAVAKEMFELRSLDLRSFGSDGVEAWLLMAMVHNCTQSPQVAIEKMVRRGIKCGSREEAAARKIENLQRQWKTAGRPVDGWV